MAKGEDICGKGGGYLWKRDIYIYTLPKTDTAPENGGFQ